MAEANSEKTILVTAATGAFGEAISHLLAAEGYNLIITGRCEEKLTNLTECLTKQYKNIKVSSLVFDFADIKTIDYVGAKLHSEAIHGIVLIGPRPIFNKDSMPSAEEWAKNFSESFVAPLEVIKVFEPYLQDNSSIIIMSGMASKQVVPGVPHTNIIRLALVGETKNLAFMFSKRKIRVNSISPGTIFTEYHKDKIHAEAERNNISFAEQMAKKTASIPLGSLGATEDIANMVLFLLSNKAKHVNGTNIVLDGGESLAY